MCTSRIFIIFARKKTRKSELDAEQLKSEAKQVNSFYVLFLNKKTVNGNLSASFMTNGRHNIYKRCPDRDTFCITHLLIVSVVVRLLYQMIEGATFEWLSELLLLLQVTLLFLPYVRSLLRYDRNGKM